MTIGFLTMPTLGTGTARVPRINEPERNASPCCFVGKEDAELIESPGMPFRAVCSTDRYSRSNACQVFKRECLASMNSLLNQGFTDTVVRVFLEPLFTSAHLFEATFRRASPNALQDLTAFLVTQTHFMDFYSTEGLTCAIGCQLNHAKINTKGLIRLSQVRSLFALGDIQIVDATSPHEISATNLPRRVNQHLMLTRAQDQSAHDTPLQGIEGHPIKTQQAIGTSVIAERTALTKLRTRLALLRFRGLDRLNGFGTSTDRQLSTKPEPATGFSIDPMVSRVGVGNMLLPTHGGNPRSGCIERLLRRVQRGFVFTSIKLDTDCPYECLVHKKSLSREKAPVKQLRLRASFFHPPLQRQGFPERDGYESLTEA